MEEFQTMPRRRSSYVNESSLHELLGTYLQVSAQFAPPTYSLRSVASAFDRCASRQPVSRFANTKDNLADGELDPDLNELERNASA
jgi:hypothetical protein